MDMIKMFDMSKIVSLLSGNYSEVFSKYFIAAAIPILIIAMLNCFLGHKIFKVFVGISGIIIGAGAGTGICIGINMFMKKGMPGFGLIGISMILGALVLGLASFKFYQAGAFGMGLVSGMILGVVIMKILNKDEYVIAAVIGGLLMGLLAIDLYKHMVILLTSVNGALISATCIAIITKNENPAYILKLGAGLAIAGIIVQYIVSLFGKKKSNEEEENNIEQKTRKSEKRLAKTRGKKSSKHHARIADKKSEKRVEKKQSKKATRHKKNNNSSGLFLVDIISNIAQFIKDKIVNYLNAEDVEEDEEVEDEEIEVEDEDEDEEIEDKKIQDKKIQDKKLNVQVKLNIQEDIKIQDKKIENEKLNAQVKLNMQENLFSNMNIEKDFERNIIENVNIPIFDIDEIGHKLEEELDNNIKSQEDEELEDLIIKQTIRNIEI